jgi:hypothetical protein
MAPKTFKFPRKPKWWMIALLVIVLVIIVAFTQKSPFQEGATGSSSSTTTNAVSGQNALGNVYTMVNTVTEPDGTIVTDTLDTEGNYVTTVYTSNTMNANTQAPNPPSTAQSTYTEIKQPRTVFQE